nr:reverse transcriptase domain-containing protein [Tanacetum cinerariifolium]
MTGGMSRGTPRDNIGSTSASIIGSTSGGPLEINVETPRTETTPSTTEQIEGRLSALGSLLKEHNERGNVSSIRLSFDDVEDRTMVRTVVTGSDIGDADLKRHFKEAVKIFLTRRIIEFGGPKFKMPANIKLYDGTTDPEDHLSQFSSAANSGDWPMPVWRSAGPVSRREDRFHMGGYEGDKQRNEERNTFNNRDGLVPYRAQTQYQAPRDQGFYHPRFNLSSLTKFPKEMLASEPQLNLQPPRPMQLPPRKENLDKYYDYHGEKGHYTNDCFQLRSVENTQTMIRWSW